MCSLCDGELKRQIKEKGTPQKKRRPFFE